MSYLSLRATSADITTATMTRASPSKNKPETVASKTRQEMKIPVKGTPNVKFDIPNVEILLPYSAEITKHTEVATGPMKKIYANLSALKSIWVGEPSTTQAATVNGTVASSICQGASARGDETQVCFLT